MRCFILCLLLVVFVVSEEIQKTKYIHNWLKNDKCHALSSCEDIDGTGCGWCWERGQAERGWKGGPIGFKSCQLWSWDAKDCAAVLSDDCQKLPYCLAIAGTQCGWCWDTNSAMQGSSTGPTNGTCHDWTWHRDDCSRHIDCTAITECRGIVGTDCGWCEDTHTGLKGNQTGPSYGSCKQWTWDSSDCVNTNGPQQIHLAYGENQTSMVLMWATFQQSNSIVYLQKENSTSNVTVTGTTVEFTRTNDKGFHYVHRVVLNDLTPGARYYYVVESNGLQSQRYSFQAMPAGNDWVAKFIVFGDMGRYGGAPVLSKLREEVANQWPIAIIHAGDFAYDLQDNDGLNGDSFLNRIQPLAASVPYMTCPGNHEDSDDFVHYRSRFSMPRSQVNDGFDMWHSWDIQNVHFISYSTEVYFSRKQDIDRQFAWLKNDLVQANQNRDKRPWIVAFGHRPMYCSNTDNDDCTTPRSIVRAGLEKLFYAYGVDLIIEAHEHSYERLWPVINEKVTQKNYTNPQAPVHLVSGAAGCNENDGDCLNPIHRPHGDWSAFRSWEQGTYGYGHLVVYNSTHLYWDQYMVGYEEIEDSIWVIQEKHGPWPTQA